MKRRIIIIYHFVLIIFPVNELHSQTTLEPSPVPKASPQLSTPVSEQPVTGSGQPIYITYPEFPNIITRTVTIPAQNTEEGYLFFGVPAGYNNDDSILMIMDDTHEFLLLDNGHAIVMAYVPIPYDLTPYGGPADGTLLEIVLQEQDANKNVVFEWIGSEHMPIGDTEVDPSPTGRLDFLHTNGIEVVDLYTSWNGATDIIAYDVYAGPTNTSLVFLGNVPSGGFETAVSLTGLPPDTGFFRTKPVHAQGNPTPFSNIIFCLDLPVCWARLSHSYMPIVRK